MGLEGDARKIPAVFISKRYGGDQRQRLQVIVFDGSLDNRQTPDDPGKMSEF